MIPEPSPDLLLVLAAIMRRLDDDDLVQLRERFVSLDEHPAAIAVVERQLALREKRLPPGA